MKYFADRIKGLSLKKVKSTDDQLGDDKQVDRS
jgi:hypothetical protein